jgi:hypothetical protein
MLPSSHFRVRVRTPPMYYMPQASSSNWCSIGISLPSRSARTHTLTLTTNIIVPRPVAHSHHNCLRPISISHFHCAPYCTYPRPSIDARSCPQVRTWTHPETLSPSQSQLEKDLDQTRTCCEHMSEQMRVEMAFKFPCTLTCFRCLSSTLQSRLEVLTLAPRAF